MAQAEESADLTAALACGSAFEEQRGPQGATRALELLSQIKQGSRENGTTARAIFSAFGDLMYLSDACVDHLLSDTLPCPL